MRSRVLLVDDQEDFRAVARKLLTGMGTDVVAEAGTAADALRLARETGPDVVLLDVRLPDGSGLDVARTLARADRPPAVVLVSTADYGYAVLGCGAAGFLLKQEPSPASLGVLLDGVT